MVILTVFAVALVADLYLFGFIGDRFAGVTAKEKDEQESLIATMIYEDEKDRELPPQPPVGPEPMIPNPKSYRYLHRPIPPSARHTPIDVRTNTFVIEGVSTGVRVKVPPLSDADKDKYGKWMFFDGYKKEFGKDRPVVDFSKYEAGDFPAEEFPEDAWQSDATYMLHFLDNAQKLIDRAREAIYEEYGFPVKGPSTDRDQALGFKKFPESEPMKGYPLMATEKNFAGLVRRLLHAMMTNQEFKVVLNGHSVAAGHDSNFWQSYVHQFHHLMEPIFARLGMKLSTYNYGRGGLGTFQDTFAGTSTLGDPDVLIWDSGMTEPCCGVVDAFYRQAIIAGSRVPFFINDRGPYPGESARISAMESKTISETPLDESKRKDVPWAIRYMFCESSAMSCNKPERRYNKGCWNNNITDFTPSTPQKGPPFGGQHPSWRSYQLTSRKLALIFLHALEEAVDLWQENTVIVGQFPLADELWHVTEHYEQIRKETQESLSDSICMTGQNSLAEPLKKVCYVPMRGKSEFTGRANPNRTALRTIVRPSPKGYVPGNNRTVVYDKPITIDWQLIPEGEVDVRAIVGAGGFDDREHRMLQRSSREMPESFEAEASTVVPNISSDRSVAADDTHPRSSKRRAGGEEIVPGEGWMLQESSPVGYCDGSTDYHSCNRGETSTCLANDHQDTRSGIYGDNLSGWIVFDIDNVVEGYVVVKFESWHKTVDERTKDWKTVNNERRRLAWPEHWPEDFEMDTAIDGVVKTYDLKTLQEKVVKAERVVELLVLHDEKPKQPKDMEVAIRLRCAEKSTPRHPCNINISYLYWA